MTKLEFWADVISTLVWPVTVLAILATLVGFRDGISAWLSRVKQANVQTPLGSVEITRELAAGEAELVPPEDSAPAVHHHATAHLTLPPLSASASATAGILYDSGGSLVRQFALMAAVSPISAITGAAMMVFNRLLTDLKAAGHQPEPSTGLTTLGRRAADLGVIPPDAAHALSRLATVQRLALKDQESVTPTQAMDFLRLADAVLSASKRDPGPPS